MNKKIFNSKDIKSYYRFRIELNAESGRYELIKIMKAGELSMFEEVYEFGKIETFRLTVPEDDSIRPRLQIGFKIKYGMQPAIKPRIFGASGIAYLWQNWEGYKEKLVYRIVGSDYIEVLWCKASRTWAVSKRLWKGKLDSQIDQLVASQD